MESDKHRLKQNITRELSLVDGELKANDMSHTHITCSCGESFNDKDDAIMHQHGIDVACVMTPHVVHDVDTLAEIDTMQMPDEVREQGYWREVQWVECRCGDWFSTREEYQEHLGELNINDIFEQC